MHIYTAQKGISTLHQLLWAVNIHMYKYTYTCIYTYTHTNTYIHIRATQYNLKLANVATRTNMDNTYKKPLSDKQRV